MYWYYLVGNSKYTTKQYRHIEHIGIIIVSIQIRNYYIVV